MDEITIASTTDTPEQMQAALDHGVKPPADDVLSTVDDEGKVEPEKVEEEGKPPAAEEKPAAEGKKDAEEKPAAVKKAAEEKPGDDELGQRAQKRINKLVAEREAEKRRADDLDARLKALEDGQKAKEKPAEVAKVDVAADDDNAEWLTKHPEPQQEDFPDYDAFVKQWTKWEMDKREDLSIRKASAAGEAAAKKVLDTDAAKKKADLEQAERAEQFERFEEAKVDARTRYDDFDAVMEAASAKPLSGAMQYVFLTSPVGHDIAYFLALPENEALAQELNELDGAEAMRELGRLEHSIELRIEGKKPAKAAEKDEKQAPKKEAATKAPAPIRPVGGRGVVTTVDLSDPNISQDDFKTIRNRQEAARRTRR